MPYLITSCSVFVTRLSVYLYCLPVFSRAVTFLRSVLLCFNARIITNTLQEQTSQQRLTTNDQIVLFTSHCSR